MHPVVSGSDVISACIKSESQLSWKRKGLGNTIVSSDSVLAFPRSMFPKCVLEASNPANLRLIRNTEGRAHPRGLDWNLNKAFRAFPVHANSLRNDASCPGCPLCFPMAAMM